MKKGKVSTTGYRANSKDKNNAFNIIPSNKISMKNVNFPVLGTDDLGNKKLMMPGEEYSFPGKYVVEVPYKKQGGNTNNMKKVTLKEAYPQQPTMNQFFGITFNPMSPVGFYQQGGQPQQGGPDQLMQEVAQALQQGTPPEQIMQMLIQNGVPQQEAQQVIQVVMQQMQGQDQGASQMPADPGMASPPMRKGGLKLPEAFPQQMTLQSVFEGRPWMKKGGWIQDATESINRRGTEGRCSGANFGGPDCPKGSRQYNLAVTFRNMAKKQFGGSSALQNSDGESVIDNRNNTMKNFLTQNTMRALAIDEGDKVAGAFMQEGGSFYNPNMYGQNQFGAAAEQGRNQMKQDMGNFVEKSYNLGMSALNSAAQQMDEDDRSYWAGQIKDPNAQPSYPQPLDNSVINPSSEVQGIDYSQSFASQMRRGGPIRKFQPGGLTGEDFNFTGEDVNNAIIEGTNFLRNFNRRSPKGTSFGSTGSTNRGSKGRGISTSFGANGNYTLGLFTGESIPNVVTGSYKEPSTTPSSNRSSNTSSNNISETTNQSGSSMTENEKSCEDTARTQEEYDACMAAKSGNTTGATTNQGTGTDLTGVGNYTEPAANQGQGSYQQLPNGQLAYISGHQPYGMFPANTNPYWKMRGRGPMWGTSKTPNIAYNPNDTYLSNYETKYGLLGRPKKVTMTFQHGQPVAKDEYGNVVNPNANVRVDSTGQPVSPTGTFDQYLQNNMDPVLYDLRMNGQGSPQDMAEFNAEKARLEAQYNNSPLRRLGAVGSTLKTPKSNPLLDKFKGKFQNLQQNMQERANTRNRRNNPVPRESGVHPDFAKRPMQWGGQSDQSKVVYKRKLGLDPEEMVNWGLAGAGALSSLFESGQDYRNQKIMESRMGADALYSVNENPSRGDYDVNSGVFRPDQTGADAQFKGQNWGQIASGNSYAQMGGSQFAQDEEYYLTDEEIAQIESMGGSVQYLD